MYRGTVIIIRGVSGSNKSSFAKFIGSFCNENVNCVICDADDYFYDKEGNYKFVREKIGEAHGECRDKFVKSIEDSVEVIIVSNTNVQVKNFQFYMDYAKENDYRIFCVVMENRNDTKDIHAVPEETLKTQESLLRNNLKLR